MPQVTGELSAAVPGEATLAGQVALVTGSGRGLGRASLSTWFTSAPDLAIHDLSDTAPAQYGEAATLVRLCSGLLGANRRGLAVTGDITDELAIKRMVQTVQSTLGPISILVNLRRRVTSEASGTKPNPTTALWRSNSRTRALSLIATCSEPCLNVPSDRPGMAERQRGVIVNIRSVAAHLWQFPLK